jgi:hypothetical protein
VFLKVAIRALGKKEAITELRSVWPIGVHGYPKAVELMKMLQFS